ncbi:MAG: 2-methylisocitrate lyase-like PEP mutase family enzyme [Paracoccaceae bacterium]|jgi:2-methylisocitrate lyase-like PEP mutase family enzyme
MPPSQIEKYEQFKALHRADAPFVIPNPWDAGTARILSSLGFAALASTSAGCAFAAGKRDSEGVLTRDEVLANAHAIVCASDLPVNADLEDGFWGRARGLRDLHFDGDCGRSGWWVDRGYHRA